MNSNGTRQGLGMLTLGALGVVYGDIGTSPLYALQIVFSMNGGVVRPTVARYLVHSIREGVMRIAPVAKIATFEDGDVLDVPGRPRVIHTPGHTRGECVLHLEQRDVLFSGDALVTLDIAPAHVGPSLLTPPFVLDLAQARASLERIEATGAKIMLPGHGEPWPHGVAEAVRIARSL